MPLSFSTLPPSSSRAERSCLFPPRGNLSHFSIVICNIALWIRSEKTFIYMRKTRCELVFILCHHQYCVLVLVVNINSQTYISHYSLFVRGMFKRIQPCILMCISLLCTIVCKTQINGKLKNAVLMIQIWWNSNYLGKRTYRSKVKAIPKECT